MQGTADEIGDQAGKNQPQVKEDRQGSEQDPNYTGLLRHVGFALSPTGKEKAQALNPGF